MIFLLSLLFSEEGDRLLTFALDLCLDAAQRDGLILASIARRRGRSRGKFYFRVQ